MKPTTMLKTALATSLGVSIFGLSSAAHAATVVDTEITFAVDVSGSVDNTEFNLQKTGYVNAFNNLDFTGSNFAANFIYWSSANEQQEAVGWKLINDNPSARAFAALIAATTRPFSGSTAPGSAINYAVPLFSSNDFDGDRWIIDVSGDGAENDGADTLTARNNALLAGVDQINGLPILGEPGLLAFYQNNIQGGVGSFTEPAASFADFGNAIERKISREIIKTTPEPSMILGFLGLGTWVAASHIKRKKG